MIVLLIFDSPRVRSVKITETSWILKHQVMYREGGKTWDTYRDRVYAKVLREVSFNALHILGSLGTTNLTPIQAMYAGAPTMGIADRLIDEMLMCP